MAIRESGQKEGVDIRRVNSEVCVDAEGGVGYGKVWRRKTVM